MDKPVPQDKITPLPKTYFFLLLFQQKKDPVHNFNFLEAKTFYHYSSY